MQRLAFLLLILPHAVAQERPYVDPVYAEKERSHWAFLTPKRPTVPESGCGNPVDAFLEVKLREKGLGFAPEADKRTLIRRLTFDLHGLPPTPAEIDAFLKDDSPSAYETLVDRLLASPHFGERQAQHWLDVVRFAESNGYEADRERPHAWRYRDYVIRCFNDDIPYDRFLTEQIAGDLLAEGQSAAEASRLRIATGLHRCGPVHMVGGNADKDELRQEVLMEMVNGLGSAVLGLTFACARCHDHKFDAISQGDYFRLQAFFADTQYAETDFATAEERKEFQRRNKELQEKIAAVKGRIAGMEAPLRAELQKAKRAKLPEQVRQALDTPDSQRTEEQKKLVKDTQPALKIAWDEVIAALPAERRELRAVWRKEQNDLEAQLPEPLPAAWGIQQGEAGETWVLNRGDAKRKRSKVSAGLPQVLADAKQPARTRFDLAKWVVSPSHPLTARVMVNRLWQHHFGRGIVASPNDFGTRGDPPTHPELLDWLACELSVDWRMKRLHKLLVMSKAYRQRSDVPTSPEAAKHDPENKLLWKMNPRRLEAEAIRDAILAAAGTLNREVGGVSVKVPLEPEVYDLIFTEDEPAGLWRVTRDERQHTRRSIYLFAKRNVRQPLLEAFDQPDTLGPCAVRGRSTFAPQALILMNGPFTREQSRRMADDLKNLAKAERINEAFVRTLGRLPWAEEVQAMEAFLEKGALADACKALFNVNEFIWVK
jgi:hypothetical protein